MTSNELEARVLRIEEAMAISSSQPAYDPSEIVELTVAVKALVEQAVNFHPMVERLEQLDLKVDHNLEDVRDVSKKARRKFTLFALVVVLFAGGLYVSNSVARVTSCEYRNAQTEAQSQFILGLVKANRNNPATPPDSTEKQLLINEFLQDSRPLSCNFFFGSVEQ